jgi:hypothetical protein
VTSWSFSFGCGGVVQLYRAVNAAARLLLFLMVICERILSQACRTAQVRHKYLFLLAYL